MTTFLDMIYFVSCNLYKRRETNTFKGSGLILFTTALIMNVGLILMIMSHSGISINYVWVHEKRYYIGLIGMLFLGSLLYFRFSRITDYDEIYNKINTLNPRVKLSYRIGASLYLLLSFISTIVYAIWTRG